MQMAVTQKLQQLATQKEQELQKIREQHYHSLENALKSYEEELMKEREKRKLLEDDFKYNLNLIEQRDHELSRYDAIFHQMKKAINERVAESSDLRVQIDDLQTKLSEALDEKGQLKQYYMQRIDQQQSHMEQFCKSKDNEVSQQRSEYEKLQKKLEGRLLQVEEELEMERQQMEKQHKEKLSSLSQDHQRKLDEMAATLLSKESHIRQLQRELATVQSCKEDTQQAATSKEEKLKELQLELRDKDWHHIDTVNTLEAKISELEGQLAHCESINKNLRNEFDCRRIELEQLSKEKEGALMTAKECHRNREMELEKQLGELRGQIEQLEIEHRRREWNNKDEVTEKQLTVEKLQSELVRVKEEGERHIACNAQEKVQHDLRLQSLQGSCDKLREDLQARMEDIERYKQELHLAIERERSLERSKNQMELDWQARLEELERNKFGHQEELLKTLSASRDEALIYCRQVEEKLIEQVKICECIREERDIALEALEKKGLTEIAREILNGRGSTSEMESLHQQNQELRHVISQMRNEMEQLAAGDVDHMERKNNKETDANNCPKSYIRYIEKELGKLKQENERLRKSHNPTGKPPQPHPKPKKEKIMNKAISQAMKTALESFQKEKATYEFDLAQLRSRVRELESTNRIKQEHAYLQKALQVPPDKVRQKLLEATQVIIQLVKEREEFKIKEEELKSQIKQLEEDVKMKQVKLTEDDVESVIEDIDNDDDQSTEGSIHSPPAQREIKRDQHVSKNRKSSQNLPRKKSQEPPKKTSQDPWAVTAPQDSLQISISQRELLQDLIRQRKPLQELIAQRKPMKSHPKQLISKSTEVDPMVVDGDNNGDLITSLSPLKFSDSSYSSELCILHKALENHGDQKSSTPNGKKSIENLIIEGKKLAKNRTNDIKKMKYNVPRPQQNTKLKIRNYNIKDD